MYGQKASVVIVTYRHTHTHKFIKCLSAVIHAARRMTKSSWTFCSAIHKAKRYSAAVEAVQPPTVVVVCVLLTHFCFNVRLFSQVCFICFNVRLF